MRNLIKIISLIVRKPEISREDFADHYEQIHVPLALVSLDGLHGYTRNHLEALISGEPPTFDCATEFWYAERAAIDRTMKFMASDDSQALRDDELTFMDKPRNTFFPVSENLILGDPAASGEAKGDARPSKFVAFLEFAHEHETDEFEARMRMEFRGDSGLLRCVQNRSLGQAAFTCVAEYWFRDREFGEQTMGRLITGAKRTTIGSVREVETQSGG